MILVYVSVGLFIVSIAMLIIAVLSFKKSSEPDFRFFSSVSDRMQEESDAIQTQLELVKEKQERLKNDLDWKKAVFTHTMAEIKKLPNTFKSSSSMKLNEYEREM